MQHTLRKTLLSLCTMATLGGWAQTATFDNFKYAGNDERFDKVIDPAKQYFNPVMAGFYPDPSICRVGDTYYMVNSSFSFYPGVPLHVSKDLVNWTLLGHVLDRPSQLPLKGQNVSGGIFAPAIEYNKKNKTFYMITTNVGAGNFYVKSTDPSKGWSDPIYLREIDGIDPSFFFDKDGKGYIVHNAPVMGGHDYEGQRAIRLLEFDVKGDSIIGEPIEIVRGGTHVEERPIWIEGPHLYRIGKYYYLMCAEGGTGAWHSEVIFRSKSPKGPWEECPHNPILTQRTGLDPNRPDFVSSTGHADMVDDGKGNWWAVFLGCRPYEQDFYNTGRDTYLLPVTWEDGWPTILESGKALPTVVDKADLDLPLDRNKAQISGNFSYTDNFRTMSELDPRWMVLRNPVDGFYNLSSEGLKINALKTNLSERKEISAVFRRQQHTNFTAETTLDFQPKSDRELAGIVAFQNERFNFIMGKTLINGKPVVVLTRAAGENVILGTAFLSDADAKQPLRLKVEGNGRYYNFYYAVGNGQWQMLTRGADAVNLSTGRSNGFIGACIGLYATAANRLPR